MDPLATPAFDARDFRRALGMFATGVTIVTARSADGAPVGVTANSFNSVSIDPPLVLWSLARSARSLPVFSQAAHWNVHILCQQQEALSNHFARVGEDKFAGLSFDAGLSDAPLLPDCSARFQCRTKFQYEGGDHLIFVGEVLAYDRSERAPLLYMTGGYAAAAPKSAAISTERPAPTAGTAPAGSALFSEDLLGYLLGRAHYQFVGQLRPQLAERGLSDSDFFVLSLLSVRPSMLPAEIGSHVAYTGVDIGPVTLHSLCERGLLAQDGQAALSLTAAGRDAILHVLAAAKAVEADLIPRLSEIEVAMLRNLLKRLIGATDPGLPKLWTAA